MPCCPADIRVLFHYAFRPLAYIRKGHTGSFTNEKHKATTKAERSALSKKNLVMGCVENARGEQYTICLIWLLLWALLVAIVRSLLLRAVQTAQQIVHALGKTKDSVLIESGLVEWLTPSLTVEPDGTQLKPLNVQELVDMRFSSPIKVWIRFLQNPPPLGLPISLKAKNISWHGQRCQCNESWNMLMGKTELL